MGETVEGKRGEEPSLAPTISRVTSDFEKKDGFFRNEVSARQEKCIGTEHTRYSWLIR